MRSMPNTGELRLLINFLASKLGAEHTNCQVDDAHQVAGALQILRYTGKTHRIHLENRGGEY